MKKIFLTVVSLVLVLGITVLFNACTEYDDLMTSSAKTGGLVTCTGSVPYKLNATPQVDLEVNILVGPGVTSVEVWNSYNNKVEGEVSNKVMIATLDVGSGNTADDVTKSYSVNYASLTKDLSFATWSFPADESDLNIGDGWTLEYVSVMADGRKVANTASSSVSVANFFAGSYVSTVWYDHPTAGLQVDNLDFNKDLLAISADECETVMGSWTDVQLFVKIDQASNFVSVRSNEDDWDALHGIEEGTNSFDPATGVIDVWYGYSRSNGTRKFHEYMVPR